MNGPANSRGVRHTFQADNTWPGAKVHYAWQCVPPNPWPKRVLAFVCGLVIGAACGTLIGGVI